MNRFVLGSTILLLIVISTIFIVYTKKDTTPYPDIACTMEAKLCPDGTAVGREGPLCEFAECPPVTESNTTSLNAKVLYDGVLITPLVVKQDSRCPSDVVCVWAGQVILQTRLEKDREVKEIYLTLGTPVIFSNKKVTLESVTPVPSSKTTITEGDYRFTFTITSL